MSTVLRGIIASILAATILGTTTSSASAQNSFGVQRPTNDYRQSSPNAAASFSSPNSIQSSGSPQTAQGTFARSAYPSVGESAALPKVGSPSKINNLLPRREIPHDSSMPPIPSVVRLIAFEKGGQSFGSGSYIGNYNDYGLIVSNWHVINDSDGLVHVHFPNGFSTYGAVIDSDQKWDLATIAISKPPAEIQPMPIAQSIPMPGEPLWIAGHGPGVYRVAGGRCVRYFAPEIPQNGTNPIYEIVELSVSARKGDSGGPILNQQGELAGVLFGSDMIRNTAGSFCGRVSKFLLRSTSILQKLPKQPEVYFASIEKEGPKRQLQETVRILPNEALVSVAAPSSVDIAGSSVSSFGVRSNSRRYVQGAPIPSSTPGAVSSNSWTPQPQPQQNVPKEQAPSSVPPTNTPVQEPIRKAVWSKPHSNIYGSISLQFPSEQFGRQVLQTGLNTATLDPNQESVKQCSLPSVDVPRDPFAVDLSSLNPKRDADEIVADAQERMQRDVIRPKYGVIPSTPYTLQPSRKKSASVPPILVLGGIVFVALLVFQAVRLIRGDYEPNNFEDDEQESVPFAQQRHAA